MGMLVRRDKTGNIFKSAAEPPPSPPGVSYFFRLYFNKLIVLMLFMSLCRFHGQKICYPQAALVTT